METAKTQDNRDGDDHDAGNLRTDTSLDIQLLGGRAADPVFTRVGEQGAKLCDKRGRIAFVQGQCQAPVGDAVFFLYFSGRIGLDKPDFLHALQLIGTAGDFLVRPVREHDVQLLRGTEFLIHDLQCPLGHGAVREVPGQVVIDPGPGDLGNTPDCGQQQDNQDHNAVSDNGFCDCVFHGCSSFPVRLQCILSHRSADVHCR